VFVAVAVTALGLGASLVRATATAWDATIYGYDSSAAPAYLGNTVSPCLTAFVGGAGERDLMEGV
jgi:hypothetical protein